MVTEQELLAELTPDTEAAARELITGARSMGLPVKVLDGFRSCAEQMQLYAQGRTLPGRKITWAPGCRSWHTHGRAFDLYLGTWDQPPYELLGAEWQTMGGRWGGEFGDYGHFEWHPETRLKDLCPDPEGACPRRLGTAALGGIGLGLVGLAAAVVIWARPR